MPSNAKKSSAGFHELVRVLGEAVQAGVTSLMLNELSKLAIPLTVRIVIFKAARK